MDNIILGTGSENFQEHMENNFYYVDKTFYLQKILMGDNQSKAPLFIRPRRFGKTLNMSMIRSFCQLNYQNPGDKSYQEQIFLDNGRNLAISGQEYKDLRAKFMGEYPVISVSFKGIEARSYTNALRTFLLTISDLYRNFIFLEDSTKINTYDRKTFSSYLDFCNHVFLDLKDDNVLSTAEYIIWNFIPFLGTMLHQEFNRKVLIIIDEYDVPLQKAVVAEEPYYDKMLENIKQISIRTFKENSHPWLFKGIVTGCLKIAHQSIFTGANNFVTNGMDTDQYADFFGFTLTETKKLLEDVDLADQESIVKEWYDGYRIGNQHLFCPWSLLQFVNYARNNKDNISPRPYWINTSGNDVIELYLKRSMNNNFSEDINKIELLLNNIPQKIILKEFTTYPDIRNKGVTFDIFMTLLLQTGYLTFTDDSPFIGQISVRIPNFEIYTCFEEKIKGLYDTSDDTWLEKARKLIKYLMINNTKEIKLIIDDFLGKFISFRNTGYESFYHGFIHGLLCIVASEKSIRANHDKESGDGFADITLDNPRSNTAVIIEFKKTENDNSKRTAGAHVAAKQIIDRKYANEFIQMQYTNIYGLGIGVGGKHCAIEPLGNLAKMNSH